MTRRLDHRGRPILVVDRRRFVPELALGQRVVHLGCVDEHVTQQRHGTGDLLHQELAAVAADLVGVDLSRAGLEEIERLVPGRYLHGDVEHLDDLDLPEDTDLVVAAELIEHLGAPSHFLEGLHRYLVRTEATAIITTPNAYSWRHFATVAARRPEAVHEDHRLLYSLVTLERSLTAADLAIVRVMVHTWRDSRSLKGRLAAIVDRAILWWQPLLAVGLVIEVAPRRP